MVNVCMYFQVHQPYRLRRYSVFDIGNKQDYFDDENNKEIIKKVSEKCYLPANQLLLSLLEKHKGRFNVAFSITGTTLEQMEKHAPEALDSFRQLAQTGHVEFLSETYHHSLAYLYSKEEFKEQLAMHKAAIKKHFGQDANVFRHTELIYNNELAKDVEDLGFSGILGEGADHLMGWRSPNFMYRPKGTENIKLMLKNYKLSDDIAFRFSNKSWEEWPLTADKYADWITGINSEGEVVNLFMDYETLGEHHWEQTGIFDFMKHVPEQILKRGDRFITPSQAISDVAAKEEIDIPEFVSWADVERDLSAWTGNEMQRNAITELYKLESQVKATNRKALVDAWKRLSTSDHFYYMSTKRSADGNVHTYFSPYDSPYEAFIAYMNVLNDLTLRSNGDFVTVTSK